MQKNQCLRVPLKLIVHTWVCSALFIVEDIDKLIESFIPFEWTAYQQMSMVLADYRALKKGYEHSKFMELLTSFRFDEESD